MKSSAVYSLGSPPAFTRTTADTNYWQERYAYEKSMNLYLLSQEDFEYQQVESTDLSTSETELDTWISSSFESWASDAIEKRKNNETVPAVPTLPTLSDNQGQLGLANFLAKLNLRIQLTLFRFGGSGELDSEDLVQEVTALKDLLETALLYEDGGSSYSILQKALLTTNASSEIISMLWLIQDKSIEVWVGTHGEIESISLVASGTS